MRRERNKLVFWRFIQHKVDVRLVRGLLVWILNIDRLSRFSNNWISANVWL
jgi:hypothetical protein